MIFKTFENNDVDKWTAKIGLFGKSFNDVIDSINKRKLDIDNLMSSGLVSSHSDAKKQVGGLFSYLYPKKDIKSQLIDVDSVFPKIDTSNVKEVKAEIIDLSKLVANNETTWQELFDTLPSGKKHFAELGQQMEGQIITEDGLIAANEKARASAIAHNNALKQQTLGAKAASVAMKGLAMAGNMIAMFAITTAITAVYKLTQVSKDVANVAQDSANSFNTSKDSLDSYKDKVEELREKMNSSSSSIADVSDARKELLSIQTEMIKKFGDEESSVKAVTDAINGQASAWDVLAKKQWDSSLNDFLTSGGKYAEFMNWLEGYNNNVDRMKDEYGSYSVNLGTANVSDDKLSQLEDIVSKITGNGLDSYNSFNFSGTASDVYDTLTTIKAAIKDSGVDFGSEFSNILENAISDAKSTSAKYKDMYNNYVLNEQILGKDNNRAKDYSSEYNKIVSAYDDYQKAQTEGDTTKIEKAKEAYAKAVSEGMDAGAAEGDTRVVEYFQSMYPELKDIVASWQFDVNFKVGSVSEKNLKDTLSKFNGYTTEDLLNFDYGNASQDQKNAYNELTRYAQQSNLSTEDYIKLLQKKGYINSDLYTRTIDRFGKYYKNGTERRSYNSKDSKRLEDFLTSQGIKNDDEKLKSFNETTKNATTVDEAINLWNESQKKVNKTPKSSFKDAWVGLDNNEDYKNTKKEILELAEAGKLTDETFAKADGGNAKKYFDSMNISAEEAVKKINETVDSAKKLSNLKSSITSIRTAYTEKKENKAASADTLGSMESEFGNLKSWKKYKQTLGSTTSSLEECRKAQNKLATEYINSNAFLDNIVDSTGKVDVATKQYYVSQLNDLGIKNSEAVVNDKIAQQLVNVNLKKKEFADVTEADIQELVNEGSQYGVTEAAIKKYVFQKYLANKSSLSTSKSVNNLITLAKQAGITGNALEALMQLESDLSSFEDIQKEWENNPSGSHAEDTKRTAQTQFWKNKIKQDKKNVKKYAKTEVKTGGGSGGTGADVDANDPNKNTGGGGKNSSSDSKTQFDWIERRITNLQTRFDRWKTIIENSSLKFIDKYYKKATSYAKKLVNTEGSAYTKYLKKANGVTISKNSKTDKSLKAKVRNGKISGKTSDLIKEYGSKTADKIQKYQDYYEKATSALDSFVEKAQELYNLPLDKAAGKIEKFSDAIDLLEKKLDNAITATAKNKIIDDEVKQKKKTYDANKSANNKAQKNLKSAGKTLKKSVGKRQKKSITKAVKNGKEVDLAKFKEGSKAYKAAVKYNAALNAKTKAQQEKDVSEQEYNYYKDIEAPKTKFDNVKDEYENKLTVIDARIQNLDNQIDNIEASGATVDNSFYKEKKKQTDQKKALLIEEKNRLAESLKGIKKYSAEWYTANDEINKVNDSIAECTKTQYELNDAIAEGNKKNFEKKLEGYQRIIDEQDFLLGLIEHEDSVDSDTGVRTDAGNARLHSYTADYYASDEKVNIATAERQRLENMKATKEYGVGYEYSSLEALNNAINDIIKTQQENIASKYSIEKKIVDEVTKSYQAQMTVLQKLIDKKKEQLETEKDIYDYQKQIKEKTKNIDTLRKQLAAMNGDTSKEAMAQKQKLQVSLNDAVDDLKDSEYDRYISDVSKMLDKLQKEYQEWQEKFLKKFDELLAEGLGIGDSTNGSYLATIAKNNGYNIQNPNANNNGKGGVNNDGSANGNTNPVKLEDNNSSNNNSSNNNSSKSSSSAPKVNNKITAIGIESEETKAKQYINKNKSKSTKPLREYSYVNQKIAALTKDKHGTYVLSTSHLKGLAKLLGVKQDGNYKKSGKLAKKLHSIGLKGFSKGGVVSVDSLNKQIRANGDDGLASVKNGEAILTPAQTEMFKQFVENMQGNLPQQNHKMSNNLANLAKVIPNNVDYGGVNFNFELNNVTNGDEFIREIQTNQKMQKALQSVTVDKINGGGRLSVNRIK